MFCHGGFIYTYVYKEEVLYWCQTLKKKYQFVTTNKLHK